MNDEAVWLRLPRGEPAPIEASWNSYCPSCIDRNLVMRPGPDSWRIDGYFRGTLTIASERRGHIGRSWIWGSPRRTRHASGLPWYGAAKPRRWSSLSRWHDEEPDAFRQKMYTHPVRLPAVVDCFECGRSVVVRHIENSLTASR